VTTYSGAACDNFHVYYTQSPIPTRPASTGAKTMPLIDGLVTP
jgi:hypothetical protein